MEFLGNVIDMKHLLWLTLRLLAGLTTLLGSRGTGAVLAGIFLDPNCPSQLEH